MWRPLLVRVSGMVTPLVAVGTDRHTPCAIVTTEVGLREKSQVGFFGCHGIQMAFEKANATGRGLCLYKNVQTGSVAH
jgi:hypothetical protein